MFDVESARGTKRRPVWLNTSLILLVARFITLHNVDMHVLVSGLLLESSDLAELNAVFRTRSVVAFGFAAVGIAFALLISSLAWSVALYVRGVRNGGISLFRTRTAYQ